MESQEKLGWLKFPIPVGTQTYVFYTINVRLNWWESCHAHTRPYLFVCCHFAKISLHLYVGPSQWPALGPDQPMEQSMELGRQQTNYFTSLFCFWTLEKTNGCFFSPPGEIINQGRTKGIISCTPEKMKGHKYQNIGSWGVEHGERRLFNTSQFWERLKKQTGENLWSLQRDLTAERGVQIHGLDRPGDLRSGTCLLGPNSVCKGREAVPMLLEGLTQMHYCDSCFSEYQSHRALWWGSISTLQYQENEMYQMPWISGSLEKVVSTTLNDSGRLTTKNKTKPQRITYSPRNNRLYKWKK